MTPAAHIPDMNPKTFDFLLFRVEPHLLGVASEQVTRVRRRNGPQTHKERQQVNLREIFNLTPPVQTDGLNTVLEVRGASGRTDIPVDVAEGTIVLTLDQIKKLPPLIDSHKSHFSFWGLALLDEEIVFLLDLDQLKPADQS